MDSRPWRLRLPTGVSWFEVDREDVLRAKSNLLRHHGAAFDADAVTLTPAPRFPLLCASWTGVSLDLQEEGWTKALLAAGFNPGQPTVWVLEVPHMTHVMRPAWAPHVDHVMKLATACIMLFRVKGQWDMGLGLKESVPETDLKQM